MDLRLKKKKNKNTERTWKTFIKRGLKLASPINSAAVAAKTNNPQADQASSKIKKSKWRKDNKLY